MEFLDYCCEYNFSEQNMKETQDSTKSISISIPSLEEADPKSDTSDCIHFFKQQDPFNLANNFSTLVQNFNKSQTKNAQKAFRYRQRKKNLKNTLQQENQAIFEYIQQYENISEFSKEIKQITIQMNAFSLRFCSQETRSNPRGSYQKLSKEVRNSSEFKNLKSLKQIINFKKQREKEKEKLINLKENNKNLILIKEKIDQYHEQQISLSSVDIYLDFDQQQ